MWVRSRNIGQPGCGCWLPGASVIDSIIDGRGVRVGITVDICHLHSVVDAGACTVIVLCAVAVAELSAAAADGGTVAVLLSSYLFLLSVAGACSCNVVVFLFSFFPQVIGPRR